MNAITSAHLEEVQKLKRTIIKALKKSGLPAIGVTHRRASQTFYEAGKDYGEKIVVVVEHLTAAFTRRGDAETLQVGILSYPPDSYEAIREALQNNGLSYTNGDHCLRVFTFWESASMSQCRE